MIILLAAESTFLREKTARYVGLKVTPQENESGWNCQHTSETCNTFFFGLQHIN
jgi:hypothetical protein